MLLDILAGSPNAGRPSPWANVSGKESGNELFGKIISSASQPAKPESTTAREIGEADASEDYGHQRRMAALAEQVDTGKAKDELAGQERKAKLYEGLQGLDQENPDFVKMATELGLKYGENPEKYAASLQESQQRSADREATNKIIESEGEANRISREKMAQDKAIEDARRQNQDERWRALEHELQRQNRMDIAKLTANRHDITVSDKEERWTEEQWQKLERRANALNASSRSAIGQSGIANVRAARAMDLLTNPSIVQDPNMFQQVLTDIDGIMKGGAPTDIQFKEHYKSLQTKLAEIMTFVQSKPTAVNAPEIKKQLMNVLQGLRDVDNQIISRNLGIQKIAFKRILEADPERAEEFYKATAEASSVFPDHSVDTAALGKMPGSDASGNIPSPKNQAEYNAIPRGTEFIDTDGKRKRKQ